jgi:uncharacterized tellurite resistance protein B-like protein
MKLLPAATRSYSDQALEQVLVHQATMISKLQKFFNSYLSESSENTATLEHRIQLASAALMIEMSHADGEVTGPEENRIKQLLDARFQLSADEMKALLDLARDKKHEATDYFEFTSLLNTHCTQQQKVSLVEDLWSIAFSDDNLDKFEEHLLRRLAELLHVPHHDFIRTKHNASARSDDR